MNHYNVAGNFSCMMVVRKVSLILLLLLGVVLSSSVALQDDPEDHGQNNKINRERSNVGGLNDQSNGAYPSSSSSPAPTPCLEGKGGKGKGSGKGKGGKGKGGEEEEDEGKGGKGKGGKGGMGSGDYTRRLAGQPSVKIAQGLDASEVSNSAQYSRYSDRAETSADDRNSYLDDSRTRLGGYYSSYGGRNKMGKGGKGKGSKSSKGGKGGKGDDDECDDESPAPSSSVESSSEPSSMPSSMPPSEPSSMPSLALTPPSTLDQCLMRPYPRLAEDTKLNQITGIVQPACKGSSGSEVVLTDPADRGSVNVGFATGTSCGDEAKNTGSNPDGNGFDDYCCTCCCNVIGNTCVSIAVCLEKAGLISDRRLNDLAYSQDDGEEPPAYVLRW